MRLRWDVDDSSLGVTRAEHYCLEFASSLCPLTVVDRTALDYLVQCPITGKQVAERIMDTAMVRGYVH